MLLINMEGTILPSLGQFTHLTVPVVAWGGQHLSVQWLNFPTGVVQKYLMASTGLAPGLVPGFVPA